MNRLAEGSFRMVVAALFFCFCVSRVEAQAQGQTPRTPPPAHATSQQSADKDKDKDQEKQNGDDENANPFAPEPAPALPPGMTGSDVNDPRAKLAPGLYDAGEAAMGIKHLMLLKKPDAFELGSNDPNAPKGNETLKTVLGVADPSKMRPAMKGVLGVLAFVDS